MSFQFDTIHVSHQLTTGIGYPSFLGFKEDVIRGSVYLDGPTVNGDENSFPHVEGSMMIGPCNNEDSPIPWICDQSIRFIDEWEISPCGADGNGAEKYGESLAHPYSLVVRAGTHKVRDTKCLDVNYKTHPIVEIESEGAAMFIGDVDIYGYTRIKDRLSVCEKADFKENVIIGESLVVGNDVTAGGTIEASGEVKSNCGGHVLSAKKNFDIPHPSKEGWRLTHTCIEGPEAAVYFRGRLRNSNEIALPDYWGNLVDIDTVTVNLQPIGSHQDIIIKRWDSKKIYLQSKGGMPIDCFYHVYAERKDTEKLIPEYEGSIEDYPGDNSQRSIAGYHYDVKED